MIELNYEKEINKELRQHIVNDSLVINSLTNTVDELNIRYNSENKRVKTERNILGGVSLGTLVLLIISLL